MSREASKILGFKQPCQPRVRGVLAQAQGATRGGNPNFPRNTKALTAKAVSAECFVELCKISRS